MGLFSSRRTPESVRERLSEASDRVRETAGEYLGNAKDHWSDVSETLREQTSQYGARTSDAAQQLDRHVRDNPWPYVAGGVAIGVVLGVVLGNRR